MHLVTHPIRDPNPDLPAVELCVDRQTLAKRLWRGRAADDVEFGFKLDAPLKHREVVFETATHRYVIAQMPESLIEIPLDVAPPAAAGIGWAIGNLHLELSAETSRLLAPDELAVRQLLDRLGVPYHRTTAVFLPGRFARAGQVAHDVGPGHRHETPTYPAANAPAP